MLLRNTNIKFTIIIFGAIFTACSESDTTSFNNEELIISNSYAINIPTYNYVDSAGTIYTVQGDTNYALLPDTVNNRPTLEWDSIFSELVTVAIFADSIQVTGEEITNITDIVWQWHSGMEFDRICRIQYSKGKNVTNGVIGNQDRPTSLQAGHYYWAVWGWNSSGIRVLFSSRQREFYVSE